MTTTMMKLIRNQCEISSAIVTECSDRADMWGGNSGLVDESVKALSDASLCHTNLSGQYRGHEAEEPPYNQWFDICGFASSYDLELSIHGKYWYNLGSTVHVMLYPPERYR